MSDDIMPDTTPWQLDVEPIIEPAPDEAPSLEPVLAPSRRDDQTPPPLERLVEALLFVATDPLAPERLAQIIRGLDAEQLRTCVRQLNQAYRQQSRPYVIEQQGVGYRFALRPRHRGVVEQLYGGVREARFSSAAVETLAVIAYRQPITKPDLDGLRGQECDAPLRQLLRRGLVTIRDKDPNGQALYSTTPRFLQLFHLKKLEELPRADDLPVS